jgi:hypothetical protein
VRAAIVIGIDEYGSDAMRLDAAVSDALSFRDWVIAEDGGGVPAENVRLLLARHPDDPEFDGADRATKDDVVTAINDVILSAPDGAERLYFYFSGHGITARVANRDESALLTPGFDELHTDHSLAIRSLTEHFETTLFEDQFFFIDACRNVPWENREFEIGRWPVPRRRDPGAPPVQQYILYATSPGKTAHEVGWPGEAQGAFTGVLMKGLAGTDDAKAWSWERSCYEVRWERLATFVNTEMRKQVPQPPADVAPADWPAQIPQDTGSRGVADRDRDAVVVSYPSGRFGSLELTVELKADKKPEEAEVSVLDAVGSPVASALKVSGESHTFELQPKTYAVRATTTEPEALVGALRAPVDLYRNCSVPVPLHPRSGDAAEPLGPAEIAASGQPEPPGKIAIRSPDPLAVAEIRDEAGHVVAVKRAGEDYEAGPGFFRISQVGPEESREAPFVVLSAGELEEPDLKPPDPPAHVARLAEAMGGGVEDGYVRPVEGAEPVTWAQPSTVVAAAVGARLHGTTLPALGDVDLAGQIGTDGSGVALFAVAGDGDQDAAGRLSVRLWAAGEPIPAESTPLAPTAAGVAAAFAPVAEPVPYWASIEPHGAQATVVSLPVLRGRLATLVAQLDSDRIRIYQFHPLLGPHESSTADRLRRVEHLERMLLAGRLDGAESLARELAGSASEDPFAGLLAGYVLLRLGRHDDLDELASAIVAVAPALSDAYILRGEYEAVSKGVESAGQAFADAVNSGVPAFGEGLTRLVEGLRASAFVHPRGALVRHIFQRHARGTMWAAFTPRRPLAQGSLVISGADLGFEG